MARSSASAVAQYLKEEEALKRTMQRREESRREAAIAIGERLIAAGALELKLPKLVRIIELAVAAGDDVALSALSGVGTPPRVKTSKPERSVDSPRGVSTTSEGTSDAQ